MLEKFKARTVAAFDNELELVAARRMTIQGKEIEAGKPIPKDVDAGARRRLWLIRHADYKKDALPTPVDPEADTAPGEQDPALEDGDEWMAEADGVKVEGPKGSWYTIKADWLDEPVKAQGEDDAKAKAAELRAEGPPPPADDEAGDDTEE